MTDNTGNKVSFKINQDSKDWAEDEQKRIRRAGRRQCTQWDLFDLMRAAYDPKTVLSAPSAKSLGKWHAQLEEILASDDQDAKRTVQAAISGAYKTMKRLAALEE